MTVAADDDDKEGMRRNRDEAEKLSVAFRIVGFPHDQGLGGAAGFVGEIEAKAGDGIDTGKRLLRPGIHGP